MTDKTPGELIEAIKRDIPGTVKDLLRCGADMNEKDVEGRTAIELAAEYGRTEIISLLLEHGADVNYRGNGKLTPLMRAAYTGRTETVRFLLEKGADVHARNGRGWTPLFFSVSRMGNAKTIRLLIEKGADVNAHSNMVVTAMEIARVQGYGYGAEDILREAPEIQRRVRHEAIARKQALLKERAPKFKLKPG
jgi:ankyrin repeat-rich membrane spanning protein